MIDPAEIQERGEALRRLAQSLEGKPVAWGPDGDDCSQLPLQWVVGWRERMTGIAPDVDGPDYSTKEEAEAVIAAAGGLVQVWEPICRQLGLVPLGPSDIPVVGDVGVFKTSFGDVGGIFVHGGAILWRHERGWRIIDVVGRSLAVHGKAGWSFPTAITKAWRL